MVKDTNWFYKCVALSLDTTSLTSRITRSKITCHHADTRLTRKTLCCYTDVFVIISIRLFGRGALQRKAQIFYRTEKSVIPVVVTVLVFSNDFKVVRRMCPKTCLRSFQKLPFSIRLLSCQQIYRNNYSALFKVGDSKTGDVNRAKHIFQPMETYHMSLHWNVNGCSAITNKVSRCCMKSTQLLLKRSFKRIYPY